LWAHNEHLRESRGMGLRRMGSYLHAALGVDLSSIALGAAEVKVGVPTEHPPVMTAWNIESWLRERYPAAEAAFVDLADAEWSRRTDWIGGCGYPVLAGSFDGFVYLSASRADRLPHWAGLTADPLEVTIRPDGVDYRFAEDGLDVVESFMVTSLETSGWLRSGTCVRSSADGHSECALVQTLGEPHQASVVVDRDEGVPGWRVAVHYVDGSPWDWEPVAVGPKGALVQGRLSRDGTQLVVSSPGAGTFPVRPTEFPPAWRGLTVKALCALVPESGELACLTPEPDDWQP
jgi:hypothetical protein